MEPAGGAVGVMVRVPLGHLLGDDEAQVLGHERPEGPMPTLSRTGAGSSSPSSANEAWPSSTTRPPLQRPCGGHLADGQRQVVLRRLEAEPQRPRLGVAVEGYLVDVAELVVDARAAVAVHQRHVRCPTTRSSRNGAAPRRGQERRGAHRHHVFAVLGLAALDLDGGGLLLLREGHHRGGRGGGLVALRPSRPSMSRPR